MKFNRPLAASVVSLAVCVSTFAQKMVFQAKVTDVIDGSTVIVETQSKTRFVVKCQATTVPLHAEPSADHSKQRLSNRVLRQMVAVEYSERNDFGHLLGTIFLDGEDVCLDQIASGLARFDPQTGNGIKPSRWELYVSSEEHARKGGTGVWATSGAAGATGQGITPNASNNGTVVDVSSYFRKDGTYVAPHKRTAPDASFDSPYTGKPRTKSWFARNWWIFPTVGALIGTSFLLRRSTGGGIPCNDGTISQAQNRQGACSHHGGIR